MDILHQLAAVHAKTCRNPCRFSTTPWRIDAINGVDSIACTDANLASPSFRMLGNVVDEVGLSNLAGSEQENGRTLTRSTLDASQLPCDSIQLFRFGWELLFANVGRHPVLDPVAQRFSFFSSLDEVVKFFFHRLFSEHEVKVSRVLPIIRVVLCFQ